MESVDQHFFLVVIGVFDPDLDRDPDPDWIRIQSGQWIRIRIRIRNPDPERNWPRTGERAGLIAALSSSLTVDRNQPNS
jgi:hypothetical protein